MDAQDQFLKEVLRRTKEILNHIWRKDGETLYEALKVFYKFFAKDDGILQTNELCHMLEFLKLPNDMLAPLIDDCIDDLKSIDLENKKDYRFEETLDVLQKYEIIQQFELNEFEKESVFNCQLFLRVLHEIGMIDLRQNNFYFNEDEFNRSRAAMRQQNEEDEENDDMLIDRNVEVEEIPEYCITDVNDLVHPLPKDYRKVFWKGYTYAKEEVLYFD
jgi:hypothetical protein